MSEKKGKKKVKAEEDEDEEFDDEFEKDFEDEKDEDEDEDEEEEEFEPEPDSYDDFKQSDDEAPPTRVLKLEVGEEIRGRLVKVEKQTSTDKRGNTIVSKLYHILSPGEEEPWRVYGTTVLDQWMANKEEGDRMGLVRDEDKPSKPGRNPTQMYHTYTIVKKKKKKHSGEKHRSEKKPKKKVHKHDEDDEDED